MDQFDGLPIKVIDVRCGKQFYMALDDKGNVYTLGYGSNRLRYSDSFSLDVSTDDCFQGKCLQFRLPSTVVKLKPLLNALKEAIPEKPESRIIYMPKREKIIPKEKHRRHDLLGTLPSFDYLGMSCGVQHAVLWTREHLKNMNNWSAFILGNCITAPAYKLGKCGSVLEKGGESTMCKDEKKESSLVGWTAKFHELKELLEKEGLEFVGIFATDDGVMAAARQLEKL